MPPKPAKLEWSIIFKWLSYVERKKAHFTSLIHTRELMVNESYGHGWSQYGYSADNIRRSHRLRFPQPLARTIVIIFIDLRSCD